MLFRSFSPPTAIWVSSIFFSTRFVSNPSSGAQQQQQNGSNSFAVSYLINSCGLCPESAVTISNRVKFQSSDNPDSVLKILKNHGFSQTQISKMMRKRPDFLTLNAQTNILPKLEFFSCKAISSAELTDTLTKYPEILIYSLEKTLIPCFDVLKRASRLDDTQLILALKRASRLPLSNLESNVAPNIALLRELGVPQSSICFLVFRGIGAVFVPHTTFVKAVKEVKDLGMDPSKVVFVLAVSVVYRMTGFKWASKFEVFGRYGWSKEEVFEAFKRHPLCMDLSDKKISGTMDFLVHKIGWPSKDIVKSSELLNYSLEKQIKPRCLVVQVLMSKGLVGKDLSLSSVLKPTEEQFQERFVTKFQETVPELLNVYRGEVDF